MQVEDELIGNIIGIIILVVVMSWVYFDAKAIGNDGGRSPNLVQTQPKLWAVGIFLMLILVLPCYLVMRVRYKRLLEERRNAFALSAKALAVGSVEAADVWPPAPLPLPAADKTEPQPSDADAC